MNSQTNSPVMSPSPVLIQPSPQQNGSISGIQTGVNPGMTHSNIQVWTPGHAGSLNVSGMAVPRTHPSMVTLPSGQTVLMTNFASPATPPPMLMPASSPINRPVSMTSVVGGRMAVSNPAPSPLAVSMPGHHIATAAMFPGPRGPLPIAIAGGVIPNSNINVPNNSSTATYISTNSATSNNDSQFLDHIANQSFSNPVVFSGGPVVLDQSSVSLPQTQPSTGSALVQSQEPHIVPSGNRTFTQSFLSDLTSDVVSTNPISVASSNASSQSVPVTLQCDPTLSSASTVSTTAQLGDQCSSSYSSPMDNTASVNTMALTTVSSGQPATEPQLTSVNDTNSTPERSDMSNSNTQMFTPATLTELMVDLDPQLQLDPDAHEVLVSLANEFITSVATKAQKLAALRDSGLIEAKDVHFCLERDWGISVPGFSSESRPLKLAPVAEAHKQRLSLIKKQIKKM